MKVEHWFIATMFLLGLLGFLWGILPSGTVNPMQAAVVGIIGTIVLVLGIALGVLLR